MTGATTAATQDAADAGADARHVRDAVRAHLADTAWDAPPTDGWVGAAAAAKLLPVVARAASRGRSPVPDEAAGAALAGVAHHLRVCADLALAAACLDAAGVRWLVVKGPVLAEVVHRVPGLRVYGDLDLLVHPADLEVALDALLAGPARLVDRNWARVRETMQGEITLALPRGTVLDLHWHVLAGRRIREQVRLDVTLLLERRTPVRVGSAEVPTLDPVDTVVHVATHAALSGAHELRWLVDVSEAVRWARPDPVVLAARAAELGCLPALTVVLDRTRRWVDPTVLRLPRPRWSQRAWPALCAAVDRRTPPGPGGGDRYSGRVVYAATRRSGASSVGPLLAGALRAARTGGARRDRVLDASLLRTEGGDAADRRAWLDHAAGHG